jgi:dipeptidyl aminopeptidase/acylaminoacyl peptidase
MSTCLPVDRFAILNPEIRQGKLGGVNKMNNPSRVALLAALALPAGIPAVAQDLMTSPLAEQFGSPPDSRNFRLSPNGERVSFLRPHPQGITVLQVLDLTSGEVNSALAGQSDGFDIDWCDWATDERLICAMFGTGGNADDPLPFSRLVAVNWDGANPQRLQSQIPMNDLLLLDDVIDWLVDEPDYVLIDAGPVLKVDINDGTTLREDGSRGEDYLGIRDDIEPYTDGSGTFRHRAIVRNRLRKVWYVRDTRESEWTLLEDRFLADPESRLFPLGYDAARTGLYAIEDRASRDSLIRIDLDENLERVTIFEHAQLEVAARRYIGKYHRLAAVAYTSDATRFELIDTVALDVRSRLAQQFPNAFIAILDEDWAGRYYLAFVRNAGGSGTVLRYDSETSGIIGIGRPFAKFENFRIEPATEISIRTADGAEIPGYLTVPSDAAETGLPLVVLTRSEPLTRFDADLHRDDWGFDFLTQYLAANGYAVLQTNYRGLGGYFVEWDDMGTFNGWRQAVSDIADGVSQLVADGRVAEDRVCVVGWGSGGYAALMSAAERGDLYRCVVSISGVVDPESYARHFRRFGTEEGVNQFVGLPDNPGRDWDVVSRAPEVEADALVIYSHNDFRVPFRQSASMVGALERRDKEVESIEYADAEHGIVPARYRIDMLARIGDFLERKIGIPEG